MVCKEPLSLRYLETAVYCLGRSFDNCLFLAILSFGFANLHRLGKLVSPDDDRKTFDKVLCLSQSARSLQNTFYLIIKVTQTFWDHLVPFNFLKTLWPALSPFQNISVSTWSSSFFGVSLVHQRKWYFTFLILVLENFPSSFSLKFFWSLSLFGGCNCTSSKWSFYGLHSECRPLVPRRLPFLRLRTCCFTPSWEAESFYRVRSPHWCTHFLFP